MSADVPVTLLAGPGSARLEARALDRAAEILCRSGGHAPRGAAGGGGAAVTAAFAATAGTAGTAGTAAAAACPDCRRTLRREHPDLLVAAPEARRRFNVPSFDESSGSRETTIPAALVRAVAESSSRLPYEAAARVLVLLDVDRTEPAAFSALLKVLEEPPRKARFILTATRSRLLPATILSRVALVRVPPLPARETIRLLVASGMREEEAEARAAFAPDGPEEAKGLDLAGARTLRDALLEAASATLLNGSAAWAVALAGVLAAEDAAATSRRLELLGTLLRDASAAAADPSGSFVFHKERFEDLARLGAAAGPRLLETASGALDLAGEISASRRNPRLAVEAFALSLPLRGAAV